MKKIAYIRVSTPDQRYDRQVLGLQALCDELHVETFSASTTKRPVYKRVLKRLKSGDMLVVWDLDRAFRSAVDALNEAEKLRMRGVHFQIATLSLDTSTPVGMFMYTVMSALAEFERRTLSQRTKEGLAAARKRGARIGRPPVLTDAQLRQARSRIENERISINRVAEDMDVHGGTLARSLRRHRALGAVDEKP